MALPSGFSGEIAAGGTRTKCGAQLAFEKIINIKIRMYIHAYVHIMNYK